MEKILNQILTEMKTINQRVENIEQGQQQLKQELRADIHKVESKVIELEIRMENEVIDKVRILFDADKVREEKLSQVVEKLDSIEIDTGYLVSRVARLEKVAKYSHNRYCGKAS